MKKFLRWIALGALSVLTCAMLFACTPSNLEKAESKMEDAGYKVETTTENLNIDGCVGMIVANKTSGSILGGDLKTDTIYAYLFDSKDSAKAYADSQEDNIITGTPTQDGKWVYWGNEDAIEDFTD